MTQEVIAKKATLSGGLFCTVGFLYSVLLKSAVAVEAKIGKVGAEKNDKV